jgi:alpha-amylase
MKKLWPAVLVTLTLVPLSGCQPFDDPLFEIKNTNSSVYYEIFVASFYDSDGDGMGDINGMREKLDYLVDLGVGGVWLMPIHPAYSYHKYDVMDFYDIDSDFGTLDDFDNYLSEATNKGIDTIIDLVINHTSDNHPWFIEGLAQYKNNECDDLSSKCHYYNFSTEWQEGYHDYGNGAYAEARFWQGMPDLNLTNPYVLEEITNIVSFWLNRGVKGFRLDAVTFYFTGNNIANIQFLQWLNDTVKDIDSEAYIVGEAWYDASNMLLPFYESGIDSFFNFPISINYNRLLQSIWTGRGNQFANYIAKYNNDIFNINPNALDAPFLSNHDQDRLAGMAMGGVDTDLRHRLIASIYLLLPGRPFIYYGEEIGLKGSGIDENKRLPIIWSRRNKKGQTNPPINANYDMSLQTVDGVNDLIKDKDSLLNHYRRIIAIRNTYNEYIERAYLTSLATHQSISGLSYQTEAGTLVILTNYSGQTINQEIEGAYEQIATISSTNQPVTATQFAEQTLIVLPPYAISVLRLIQS